ncbi:MAG: glycoside hydrolase family 3 N-terminal domain-containing protein, partial [Acidobacteriota bacterium]|nr:glycoside hydrolase family 3 N-terminal domain-containing protein [Acidobacteriota bacterium]
MNAAIAPGAPALRLALALLGVLALLGALALLASPAPALAEEATAEPAQELDLEALVGSMTLDEKIGQLNQIPGGRSKNLNSRIDAGEHDRIRRGAVGSYLHVAGAEVLGELQRVAVEESRLGIPLLFAMDVVHGYRTIFPVPLAMASTFDPELVRRTARAAAVEASASGLHWTFAPMVDIARDARWGRIVEGAGEDPYLGARMAAAQVQGFQGEDLAAADTLAATAKHFGAYGAAIGGRDYNSADLSQRTLEEIFLPPFFAAQQVGAASFMTAFNDVGGVPTTANGELLRDLLRDGWGYDGVVLSDWNAVAELIDHGVAGTRRDAAALALAAGVDMDMSSLAFSQQLAAAVRARPELEPLLDQAVLRVLRMKQRLGLFDDPYRYHDPAREATVILSPEHRALAREAARKSVVLLKNDDGLLPLDPDLESLAVVGALADDGLSALGSWRAQGRAEDVVTLVAGLRAALPGKTIHFVPGADSRRGDTDGIPAAVERVKGSDLTVLVVGEDYDWSGEARSRSDLGLPGAQLPLARAVLSQAQESGKPVVVLLLNGRPMTLPWLAEHAGTLVEAWLPGVEGGHGIADVLTGKAAPGGKLPASFPRTTGQVPLYYNHLNTGRPAHPDPERDTARYMDLPITPLFPFGHGLSYADFVYSPLEVQVAEDGTVTASVTVTHAGNGTGEHHAEEVVQLYARDPVARVARPVQELRGFHRLALEPGESQRVRFQLRPEQFAIYHHGQWVVEPGEILLSVGSSSADIRGRGSFVIEAASTSSIPPAAIATPSTATPGELSEGGDTHPAGLIQAYAPSFHRLIDVGAE